MGTKDQSAITRSRPSRCKRRPTDTGRVLQDRSLAGATQCPLNLQLYSNLSGSSIRRIPTDFHTRARHAHRHAFVDHSQHLDPLHPPDIFGLGTTHVKRD